MNSLSDPFIKRPVMTILIYLSVVAFGVYSYLVLPVSDLPDVDYPVIQVTAAYPGASPQVMANNIATPLEQQFLQIPGIEIVTSNSAQGLTSLVLQFHLEKSIDNAASDVQAAINKAQGSLPTDLPSPPSFQKTNPNAQPVMYIGVISYSMTSAQLYDYAFTEIAQRIQLVPGVSSVATYGSPRAVRVQVDPLKLYTRGLTFNDISGAVRQGTTLVSAGQVKGQHVQMTIAPQTQLEKVEDYANLIIAHKDGAPIYLRDVADVVNSTQVEDLRMDYWSRQVPPGAAGVVLAVTKADGANAVAVAHGVRKLAVDLKDLIPPAIQIYPIYDRSVSIENSVEDVTHTLLIAFALVVLVVFLFLGRVGDTVIPMVALPMSLLITFSVMHLLGYTLDNLSLMALTLSVGFLIDDAIVFLENVVRRMEAGEALGPAVFNGAKEISFTIMAMTLSLGAVFIPLVGLGGLIGRIFREFSVTIIVAVIASGVVSLTLTPMMCSRVLASHKAGTHTIFERFARWLETRLLAIYGPMLTYFLRHWYWSVLAYGICFFGIFWFYNNLPKSFLPVGDSSFISGVWLVDTPTSPIQMREYQKKVDAVLESSPYVNAFVSVSGFSQFLNSNQGIMFMMLKNPKERPGVSIDQVNGMLIGQMMQQIPGIFPAIRPQPVLQISVGASRQFSGKYSYVLSGLNKDQVYGGGLKLIGAMMQSGLFSQASPDFFNDNRQLQLFPNREIGSTYGVTGLGLAQTLSSAYSQNYSYLIKGEHMQYWVVVEAKPDSRNQAGNLDELYFASLTNQSNLYNNSKVDLLNDKLVSFRTLADTKVDVGPLAINHYNGFTSFTINYDLNPGVSIGQATDFIDKTAGQTIASEVTRGFQGEAKVFRQAAHDMIGMFLVALFVMYVILGILYESYVHPFTVLFALIIALAGGLGALTFIHSDLSRRLFGEWWAAHTDLSLYAGIGLFMLAGLVKKNGIMMIDFAIARQAEGRTPREAVHEASMERFRPIMMTTLAAFFGILPLAMGVGADAESRLPLGITVCGGLILSQVITLFVTPVTYLGFEWLQTHVLDNLPLVSRRKEPASS